MPGQPGRMTQTMSRGTRRPRLGRHYWRLWWANAISSTGDGAFVAALPLLAVTISRDPRLVAAVTGGRQRGRRAGEPGVDPLAGGFVAHAAGLRAPYLVAGLLCGLSVLAAVPLLLAADQDRAGRD